MSSQSSATLDAAETRSPQWRGRILHCIASMGGGGAERQLAYLAEELTRSGAEVHIVYLRGGPNLDFVRDCGVHLHQVACAGNHDPLLILRLVRTIRAVKPDVVQTWLPQMDVLAGIASLLTGTPFVTTERSSAPGYGANWKEFVRRRIAQRAAMVVANSEAGRQYWRSHRRRPIRVIRNGIPLERIRDSVTTAEPHDLPVEAEIVLFGGRYSAEKNLPVLVDALTRVCRERPNTVALLFGEGPLREVLVEQLGRNALQHRIRLLDYTHELWGWMRRASVFVSVSLFEGCPNTVLEAAVQRCPVVVSDIPQHRELLDAGDAVFVSPHDARDIARGILDVLRDPDGANPRAQRACEKVAQFTIHSVGREYLDLYNEIVAARRR